MRGSRKTTTIRSATWDDIKTSLKSLDRVALMALIRDLYQADASNRRMLQARFTPTRQSVNEYRRLVRDLVFPDPFSEEPIRLRDASAIIREYRRATRDLPGTVELMLELVEAGTEQAADLGYGEDAYFEALERQLQDIVRALDQLTDVDRTAIVARILRLAKYEGSIGWGYGDFLADISVAVQHRFGQQSRHPNRATGSRTRKPQR